LLELGKNVHDVQARYCGASWRTGERPGVSEAAFGSSAPQDGRALDRALLGKASTPDIGIRSGSEMECC